MMKLNLQLPLSIFREGKHFVAYTPALDLSTSGKSYEEVKRRFDEIVVIFLEELMKKGTLDEVLDGLGWRKIKGMNTSGQAPNPTGSRRKRRGIQHLF